VANFSITKVHSRFLFIPAVLAHSKFELRSKTAVLVLLLNLISGTTPSAFSVLEHLAIRFHFALFLLKGSPLSFFVGVFCLEMARLIFQSTTKILRTTCFRFGLDYDWP